MNTKYIPILFFLLWGISLSAQVQGRVFSTDNLPLPGAAVLLLPDSIGTVTDIDGTFSFYNIVPGKYTLEVRFVGFQMTQREIVVSNRETSVATIILEEKSELLETVVITDEHAKQEMSLASEHISKEFIEQNLQGTFAKSIEKLPGISAINVGVGIAKPVIRGLSFNRIIVNHQGIKQESQQWGADHGLELDQFDVERVEIIKGPASLQYGSDGLGGVINIMPGHIQPKNTIEGSVLGVHKTNNQHWGGSAKLGVNIDDFFVVGRYSQQEFGDYQVPADQFIYNGFVLPIYNNTLKNTAGKEQNLSLTAGLNRGWGITRILFSKYSLQAGLFSGAVGIPRSYALTDDGNSRDLDIPKQEVDHYRISLNQTLILGQDHLNINIGYQKNLRQEFTYPEFHSIPSSLIDPNNTLGLELDLQTISANLHYEMHPFHGWKTIYGIDVQWQENKRGGFEFLLPDFRTFRGGAFVLGERELTESFILNAGIRFDYGENESDYYRQFVWDSNENITDSLVAPITEQSYYNWSASVGASRVLVEDRWYLKANLGKSFRVPYPAETVSNGIHHGTFRHEVGTPDLKSEHGYQLDLSTDVKWSRFHGTLSGYFNYFNNYIYLGPTFPARFSPLPEAGQIFRYRQDDAIYTGFELQWTYHITNWLQLEQAADFVQSYNLNTKLALPFTPQPAIKTDLRYELKNKGMLGNLFVEVGHQYHFAAKGLYRVDRSENPTPAYQLLSVGLGGKLNWKGQAIQLNVQVQNLLDTYYLNHLSRYRLINVPEQGRNVVMTLKVPFGVNLQ